MDLSSLTIQRIHDGYRGKLFSCSEIVRAYLDRIDKTEPVLHAFITVCGEQALERAKIIDKKMHDKEELRALEGIPFCAKDLFCTKGVQTTAGSRILEGFIPPYNATVIQRLVDAGAVLLGKNTEDEFGHGCSSENTGFDVPRNPWDTSRVAGGSSGGSAVSVSANQAVFSLGTDTGGSVRLPSSFCNVAGLKPTYGRVSRFGVIAMASSLDTIGCMARNIEDVSKVMSVMAGYDRYDSTTLQREVPDYNIMFEHAEIRGLKIGVPEEYFGEGIDSEIAHAVKSAIAKFEELGADIINISLPHTKYGVAAYYIICPSEVSANMARYDGIRYGPTSFDSSDLLGMYLQNRTKFHPEVKRRIMMGTYALSSGYYDAYYLKAQKVRTLVKQDFDKAFEEVDVIVTPVFPSSPFKIGEKSDDPLQMYMSDVFTIPASLAGLCGLSVPCGFVNNLPVGLQIIGPQFGEDVILKAGYVYQTNTEWNERKPAVAS